MTARPEERRLRGAVVLGMHRSGTSAVTRLLNLLGAAVPAEDDLLVNYDNPDGHWESRTLVGLNDRILAGFGRSWDFPPRLGSGWEASGRVSGLVPELEEAFASVYPAAPWVWKDPRSCLTFPLWRQVLGDDLCAVLVFRSPAAVTRSLRRRDGIPRLYGAALWLEYLTATLRAACGLPTLCVDFDELRSGPEEVTGRLAAELASLGLALGGDVQQAAASVRVAELPGKGSARVQGWVDAEVQRLTAPAEDLVRALPRCSASFDPPAWREPRWVLPLLFAYRGPWVLRARLGRPLKPRLA